MCDQTPQSKLKHTNGKYYCPAGAPWSTGASGMDQRIHPARLNAPDKQKMFDFACMKTQACAQEYNTTWSSSSEYSYAPVRLLLPPAGIVPVIEARTKDRPNRIKFNAWEAFKKRADSKSIALALALFIVAFYMSWACNGSLGAAPRLGYAMIAGAFGLFYVPYALLFKYKKCSSAWV